MPGTSHGARKRRITGVAGGRRFIGVTSRLRTRHYALVIVHARPIPTKTLRIIMRAHTPSAGRTATYRHQPFGPPSAVRTAISRRLYRHQPFLPPSAVPTAISCSYRHQPFLPPSESAIKAGPLTVIYEAAMQRAPPQVSRARCGRYEYNGGEGDMSVMCNIPY